MTIIIPMAGLSARFLTAGYTLPKYMLYVKDKSLFNLAVSSFDKYFTTCRFIFITRNIFDTETFIHDECKLLGIHNSTVVILDKPTRGQAETVFKGIENVYIPNSEPILIFNIDTFRPNFVFPESLGEWDGYLEVFKGSGKNWSYAKTKNNTSTKVIETAEKQEISEFCSTGIYYFRSASYFKDAYNEYLHMPLSKELYVAPLYNILIGNGKNIHINLIKREDVVFCGTPHEYINYLYQVVNVSVNA